MRVDVALEVGTRRVFATALDWPGWSRAGRDGQAALDALVEAAPRYALVARQAGVAFRPGAGPVPTVLERVKGDATTDFGAPGRPAARDGRPLSAAQARRRADLVEAAWQVFDTVVAGAPEHLRKGPRGGGRDRDAVVAHVLAAESGYARKLGIRLPVPHSVADANELRTAILGALRAARSGEPPQPRGWSPRYAAARIAWHVLDHAWEIEDKSG